MTIFVLIIIVLFTLALMLMLGAAKAAARADRAMGGFEREEEVKLPGRCATIIDAKHRFFGEKGGEHGTV